MTGAGAFHRGRHGWMEGDRGERVDGESVGLNYSLLVYRMNEGRRKNSRPLLSLQSVISP